MPGGRGPRRRLDFRLPASGTGREYIPGVVITQSAVVGHGNPGTLMETKVKLAWPRGWSF